ncbi:MAG: hypothetical protein ACOWW1_02675 [archaeon]
MLIIPGSSGKQHWTCINWGISKEEAALTVSSMMASTSGVYLFL